MELPFQRGFLFLSCQVFLIVIQGYVDEFIHVYSFLLYDFKSYTV
nr:MAG TPA: hypothetical protein [Caudoviricetes sp.]